MNSFITQRGSRGNIRQAAAWLLAVGCSQGASRAPLSSAEAEPNVPSSNRVARSKAAPVSSATPERPGEQPAQPPAPTARPGLEQKAVSEPPVVQAKGAHGPLRVELVDAGKQPRETLRFTYHPKETFTLRLHSQGTVSVDTGAQAINQPIPDMEFIGSLETRSVEADGSAHRAGSYSAARLLPTPGVSRAVEAQVAKAIDGFTGVTFSEFVSTRGETLEQEFDWKSITDPQFRKMFEGMSEGFSQSPLPVEAVGPGARWRTHKLRKSNKLSIEQDIETTLLSIKGKTIELRVEVKGHGVPESSIADNQQTFVESVESNASGHQLITLDPLGLDSTSSVESVTVTVMKGVRMKMRMALKNQTTLHR